VVVELGGIDGKVEDNETRLDTTDSVDIEADGRENDMEDVVGELALELVKLRTEDGALDPTASKSVRFAKFRVGNTPPVFEQVSIN
jgi:hypothetical protein